MTNDATPRDARIGALTQRMQAWNLLEDPPPAAAMRWVALFLEAYSLELDSLDAARPQIEALRAEAATIAALDLEYLRTREVLFFLDNVGQYVDHQAELRDLPIDHDLAQIAQEFGLTQADAQTAVRLALTGARQGPPLALLFPLLGHDRILMRIGAVNSKLLHGRGLEPIPYGPDGKPFTPMRGAAPEDP